MKVASLLSQYLYEHQQLDLPGIGSFHFIPDIISEEENKRSKQQPGGSVTFENNPFIKDNQDLVSFISSHTGKIKALAAADLESHLELAKQFLNIGKPFLFEGIGTLVKIKSGEYGIKPVTASSGETKSSSTRNLSTSVQENLPGGYSGLLMPKKEKMNWRKPAIVILLLGGIGLAVWGGYVVYKMTAGKNKTTDTAELKKEEHASSNKTDSSNLAQENNLTTVIPAGQFKFVIETADSARAYQRYNKLKSFGLDIKMEPADSVRIKLFFILPSSISDTARMIDSLRGIYTPVWSRAYVE